MPIASFEEENNLIQQTAIAPQNMLSGMAGFLVRRGLAKDERSAEITLIVLATVSVLAALFFFAKGLSGGESTLSTEELNRYIEDMRNIPPPPQSYGF